MVWSSASTSVWAGYVEEDGLAIVVEAAVMTKGGLWSRTYNNIAGRFSYLLHDRVYTPLVRLLAQALTHACDSRRVHKLKAHLCVCACVGRVSGHVSTPLLHTPTHTHVHKWSFDKVHLSHAGTNTLPSPTSSFHNSSTPPISVINRCRSVYWTHSSRFISPS